MNQSNNLIQLNDLITADINIPKTNSETQSNLLINESNDSKKDSNIPVINEYKIPSYSNNNQSNQIESSSDTINVNAPSKNNDNLNSVSSEEVEHKKILSNDLKNTLHEPVMDTIKRDFKLMYIKMKYVLNPFIKEEDRTKMVRQWDLWGPLIFVIFLALTIFIRKGNISEKQFTLVFIIFWIGGFLVYLNANLLGSTASLFQILCLMGYSLFPLNILAILFCFNKIPEFIKVIFAIATLVWCCFSIKGFLVGSISDDKKYMVLYPAVLVFLFLIGNIYTN